MTPYRMTAVPDDPGPGDPAPGADAAADAACFPAAAGGVPAGAPVRPPGDRPGSPGCCGPDGAAPATAGGPGGTGLSRTVTVTKRA